MAVDTTPLNDMTAVDDRVKQMVLAMPDFSVGDQVHTIFVNKLAGSTPGQHTEEFSSSGPRFIDIFFPGWQPVSFEDNVSGSTGLSDDWWSSFAVAVLCQSMDALAQDLRDQLLSDKINGAVSSFNATLNSQAAPFYSLVFSQTFADFSTPFASMDHPTALAQYQQVLMDGVNLHALWYSEGLWKNPDWEMFHHYIKLYALGLSLAEIDQFIGQLQNAGLPIPDDMAPGKWYTYSEYLFNKTTIDHTDIDSMASDGITRSEYLPGFDGPGTNMNEENSFEFTADGQPGSMYRGSASGSCFSSDTLILMQDRSLKRIDQIQPGERIASPNGPREVAFVTVPLRGERTLYSLNDHTFRFTASHPFLNGDAAAGKPYLQSVEPAELRKWVPFLAKGGIGQLAPGASVRAIDPKAPEQITAVPVQALHQHDPGDTDVLLYDVVLQPDQSGVFEYFAGDADNLFLVASELPHMFKSPYATRAMIGMLAGALPAIQENFASLDKAAFTDVMRLLKRRASSELVHRSLLALDTAMGETAVNSLPGLNEMVANVMQAFVTPEKGYNWQAGQAYEILTARLAEEVESVIEVGWRVIPKAEGARLAISLADLHLDHHHSIPMDEPLHLVVRFEAAGGHVEEKLILSADKREPTPFMRYFDRVLYFDTGLAKARAAKRLVFRLYAGQTDQPLLTATAHLPHRLQPAYRRFSPRVYSQNGQACGHLYFDVRHLSAEEIAQEKARHERWQAAAKESFAQQLGSQMGKELIQLVNMLVPKAGAAAANSFEEMPSVRVTQILADPAGDEVSGEFVVVQNQGSATVNLTSWTLSDEKGHTYTFPAFELPAQASVRVWTKCGGNAPQNLYWCRKRAVWNNSGDTAYLKDGNGRLIDSHQ